MLNTDMVGADYWLDRLMELKDHPMDLVPTSLLVESGKLPSAMPEFVKDFGKTPDDFKTKEFLRHAEKIMKIGKMEPGRLFMPILVDRQQFFDVGGYPECNPPGTTGDKDLIRRYKEAGFDHITALGSVVYHVQLGEQQWP